jgi:NADH:ubiquinone oxidoreductase subunit H
LVGILLSVAFFTLFERKILGLSQNRIGPNKVFFFGIIQPFLDGVKLLTKEFFFPIFSNMFSIIWGPSFFFIVIILV